MTLNIGVIGSGGRAAGCLQAFADLDGCKPVALAARNKATGKPLAKQFQIDLYDEWRQVVELEGVDAVAVMTYNDSHGPIAIAALEAGKHVYMEYPLARHQEEGAHILDLAERTNRVVRTTHNEPLSPRHQALKPAIADWGSLLTGLFVRLTPGRGARPEILFNLNASGPPALFFVYQVYPVVDLLGPAAWVQAHTEYVDLKEDTGYHRFVNQVTVGLKSGGTYQWTWAGGVEIAAAEQYQRLVFAGGSLVQQDGGWCRFTASGLDPVIPALASTERTSLEQLFLADVAATTSGAMTDWTQDLQRAYQAAQIGWAAEQSAAEGHRIEL